jgi:predicted phosphodiesterase
MELDYISNGYKSGIEDVVGTLIVVGDTHISMKYTGTHKDYSKTSIRVMRRIIEIVKNHAESGKVSLMILGDVFGVNERNINNEAFLSSIGLLFNQLNSLTEGRVFAVRGNHDMGAYTTFDFACDQGWIKNPMQLDYKNSSDEVIARYHVLNYGREGRDLNILEGDDSVNVIFAHNDFVIPSVTTWYENEASKWNGNHVDLEEASNFEGADIIVSGHIHTPNISEDLVTTLPDGQSIRLFYLGSPSRVAERYTDCYVMTFTPEDSGDISNDLELFGLWPLEEEFVKSDLTDDEKIQQKILADRERDFQKTLDDFMNNPIDVTVSIKDQINNNEMFTHEQRETALRYYQARLDSGTKH